MNTSPAEPVPGWDQILYAGAAGIALAHIEYAHAGLRKLGHRSAPGMPHPRVNNPGRSQPV
jgi:hypothetical protein